MVDTDALTPPESIDVLIVASGRDLRLLRHFFASYQAFYRSPGNIHLFVWRKEQYILDKIACPANLVVHYKDDIPDLGPDDFRNQMYLKLTADLYVDTEWVWIVDADYLICAPLDRSDLFSGGKAIWYYRDWSDVSERSWRAGTERYLGHAISHNMMDEPLYLLNKSILRDFRQQVEFGDILHAEIVPSEFIAYGAFARRFHPDSYEWIDAEENGTQFISYRVNQRPPDFNTLDETVSLDAIGSAKVAVFWSHWVLAEAKMKEFLRAAAGRLTPPVPLEPDESDIVLEASPAALQAGQFSEVSGLHLDQWTHTTVKFLYAAALPETLVVTLDSPGRDAALAQTHVEISVNDVPVMTRVLSPGLNSLDIAVNEPGLALVVMQFTCGMPEPNGNRTLFARLISIGFHPQA